MKLMPASRAFATMRVEVASSVGPPNIMVPRQIGDPFRPLRPSLLYCIRCSLFVIPGRCGKHRTRNLEISGSGSSDHPGMTLLTFRPQNLEHAIGHGDDALVDGDLGRDEDQASRGADHPRPRHQELADLAGLDELHVE